MPFDFQGLLSNPSLLATGAALLDPRGTYGSFGASLNNGLSAYLAAQRQQMLMQIQRAQLQQAMQAREQQAAEQRARQAALLAITATPEGQGQPMLQRNPAAAAQQLIAAGDLEGGLNLMKTFGAADIGAVSPSSYTPASIAKYAQTGNYNDLVPVERTPLVQIGGDYKIPAGFKPNPAAGQPGEPDVMPITGGPEGRKTPEQAGKLALLAGAKEAVPTVRNAIINPETGAIDRVLISTMQANAPFTQGRVVRAQILDAMEAKLRAESGAAVPKTEVERAAERFMPSPLDSDEGVADKLNRLQKFMDTALEIADPELYKRLSAEIAAPSGKVQDRKTVNGRVFIKQNGQWFEVGQ